MDITYVYFNILQVEMYILKSPFKLYNITCRNLKISVYILCNIVCLLETQQIFFNEINLLRFSNNKYKMSVSHSYIHPALLKT